MSSTPSLLTDPEPQTESPLPDTTSNAGKTAVSGPESPRSSLYRVIWRWHFYAGLIVAPFLFFASATGAIYIFSNELSSFFYRDLYLVEPAGERMNYDEQLARLKEQAPEASDLDGLSLWNDPRRSVQFLFHAMPGGDSNPNQLHQIYFVNPYTGALLGSRIMEKEFFHVVLDLHRSLCAGTTGRVFVELATCWGLVLTFTGLVLWWPRGKLNGAGVWWPRLRRKTYVVLRDLHSVFGMYTAVFAIIVLFTGLFVSQVWGTGFTWVSTKMEQSLFEFFTHAESPPAPGTHPVSKFDPVVKTAMQASRPGDNIYVQIAGTPEQAHKIYLMHDSDTNTVRGLDIDQYTGALVHATQTEELEPMVRLLALMVSLHQGRTFGTPSKIVALITCLVLMGLSITGVWMWWDRRPRGKTGFPARPDRGVVPLWGWGIVILTGLILPTVGASIVVIALLDWTIQKFRAKPPIVAG